MKVLVAAIALAGCTRASTQTQSIDAAPPPEPVTIDAAPVVAPPGPPPPPGPLMIVTRGMIVLDDKAPRAHGPARVDGGEVPVDDSAADHGSFAASRAVDPARARDDQRAWVGREVLLGGNGVRCLGRVTELRALAQVVGLHGETFDDEADLAEAVLQAGHPALVGVVEAPCAYAADWAVPASSLPPIAWSFDTGTLKGPAGSVTLDLEVTGYGCPDNTTYRLDLGNTTIASGRRPFTLRDVIDYDHDGWPELVLADGWLAPIGPTHEYQRLTLFRHAYDWYLCIE